METERLHFKRFEKDDFDHYFQLVSNEDVMKMISGKSFSKEKAINKYDELLTLNAFNPEIGYYVITNKETNLFIGLAKIVLTKTNEAEIGYSLLPEHWKKGYASEISIKLVDYCKTVANINTIVGFIDPENKASKRVLEKSGLTFLKSTIENGVCSEIYSLKINK